MQEDSWWKYQELWISGENENLTQAEMAQICGVTAQTLIVWDKTKIDWDHIKTERRKKYGGKMIDVDNAMFKAAGKGNVNAAELVYKRFDGYIPTNLTLEQKADEGLLEEAEKILAKLKGPVGPIPDSPGTGSPAAG